MTAPLRKIRPLARGVRRLVADGRRPGQARDRQNRHPSRRVFGIDTTVVRFDEAVYYVPDYAAHRPVARRTLNQRRVEPPLHHLVEKVMARRPGSLVHAGTFFGDMLPSFSRKTPGLLYAFEPVIENYVLSHHVVDDNALDNVVLLNAGLGAAPGVVEVQTGRGGRHRGGASKIVPGRTAPDARTHKASVLTVDQLDVQDLSMIQLDVEGYERPALEGARRTIEAQQPVIVVEDNKRECHPLLDELGYVGVGKVGPDDVYVPEAEADAYREQ